MRVRDETGWSVGAPERPQVEYARAYDLRRVIAPWLMSDMSDIFYWEPAQSGLSRRSISADI